jgi:hypothetical protein
MVAKMVQSFGTEAQFLKTLKYPLDPRPENPKSNLNKAYWDILDPSEQEVQVEDYTYNLKSWRKRSEARIETRAQVYSYIFTNMSIDSKAKVACDATWGAVQTKEDPLELWLLIIKTHEVGGELLLVDFTMRRAIVQFTTMKMTQSESPAEYKFRADELIRSYTAIIGYAPLAHHQAFIFSGGLDPSRYAAFEHDLAMLVNRKVMLFPADLLTMYTEITNWSPTPVNNKAVPTPGVYAVATSAAPKSKKSNFKLPVSNARAAPISDKSDCESNSKRSPPLPCKFCQGPHWISASVGVKVR